MILEVYDHPEYSESTYAVLLVADYHMEYPLAEDVKGSRVFIFWNPFTLESVGHAVRGINPKYGEPDPVEDTVQNFGQILFEGLENKYGHHYEVGMNLWYVQGNRAELEEVFYRHADTMFGGPFGADDDTYDYWPNAFEMLSEMALDLCRLYPDGTNNYLGRIDEVVAEAIKVKGPAEDWESPEIEEATDHIRKLVEQEGVWKWKDRA